MTTVQKMQNDLEVVVLSLFPSSEMKNDRKQTLTTGDHNKAGTSLRHWTSPVISSGQSFVKWSSAGLLHSPALLKGEKKENNKRRSFTSI